MFPRLFIPCDGVLSNVFAGFVCFLQRLCCWRGGNQTPFSHGKPQNTGTPLTYPHRHPPFAPNHNADCQESLDETQDYDCSQVAWRIISPFGIPEKEFQAGFVFGATAPRRRMEKVFHHAPNKGIAQLKGPGRRLHGADATGCEIYVACAAFGWRLFMKVKEWRGVRGEASGAGEARP